MAIALMNCPECGKEVSSTVKKYPHCGFTIKKLQSKENREQNKKIILVVSIILSIFIMIGIAVRIGTQS